MQITTRPKSTKNIRHSAVHPPTASSAPQCLPPLPSTWVTLLELPTPDCFDEAWLMCQYPDGHWAAWIPDFGEIKLHSGQFCRMS